MPGPYNEAMDSHAPVCRIALPLVAMLVVFGAACHNDTSLAPVCGNGFPTIDVDPQTPFVQVHDTLTLQAKFNACANLSRPGVWRWRTSNSSIVAVDTAKGRLTGIAQGQAAVFVTDSIDRSQSGFVFVNVTPPMAGGG